MKCCPKGRMAQYTELQLKEQTSCTWCRYYSFQMRLIKLQFVSRINHLHHCCIFVDHLLLWKAEAKQNNKKTSLHLHLEINRLRTMRLHLYIFKSHQGLLSCPKGLQLSQTVTGSTLKLKGLLLNINNCSTWPLIFIESQDGLGWNGT